MVPTQPVLLLGLLTATAPLSLSHPIAQEEQDHRPAANATSLGRGFNACTFAIAELPDEPRTVHDAQRLFYDPNDPSVYALPKTGSARRCVAEVRAINRQVGDLATWAILKDTLAQMNEEIYEDGRRSRESVLQRWRFEGQAARLKVQLTYTRYIGANGTVVEGEGPEEDGGVLSA